jgi:hypothetical protein
MTVSRVRPGARRLSLSRTVTYHDAGWLQGFFAIRGGFSFDSIFVRVAVTAQPSGNNGRCRNVSDVNWNFRRRWAGR